MLSASARTTMVLALLSQAIPGSVAIAADIPQFGRAPTQGEITAWNIDAEPDGGGLPIGRGTVERGKDVFAEHCAVCHGATGVEGPKDRLVGGLGTLNTVQPIKTVGSYWPYAPTAFDYINRAMPYTAPGSLATDDVYSVVAWLLYRNGVLPPDGVLDQVSLPKVKMPNRDGFLPENVFAEPVQHASR